MNIGFDMDGVLRRLDLSLFKFRDAINNKEAHEALEMHIRRETEPLFNPMMFALPSDDIYCITNCSSENSAERKKKWLNHFYGGRIEIVPVYAAQGKWGNEYVDEVAKNKLEKCHEYEIEIYIDDDPAIIRRMRELHNDELKDFAKSEGIHLMPYVKFLKYGAWLEEVY